MAGGGLLTDLYQLNMLQAYLAEGMTGEAVFEFFVRKLPPRRNFLVAAGLQQALEYLTGLRFTAEELDWLAASGHVDRSVVDYLAGFRFSGDVYAPPEGTMVFANEPILRVVAPLPEAQLVESRLINILQFQTMIASKAARMVLAAPGRRLVDFGFRRAHGAEAGLFAARAAYLAGFAGTATVEAERVFGIPSIGTVAHSFIQAHDGEATAFRSFARAKPRNAVLLIDTYDTLAAARKVAEMAPAFAAEGLAVSGVRLDSGDLAGLSKGVRQILDEAGLQDIAIFASSGIDETVLADLASSGAPIDGYGIGTKLATSADAPFLDCAYKLQEYGGRPRRKLSPGKATWPGRKQVFRRHEVGRMAGDVLTVEGDAQAGSPLIRCVMRAGRVLMPQPALDEARSRAAAELAALPEQLRDLRRSARYPVRVSAALRALTREADAQIAGG